MKILEFLLTILCISIPIGVLVVAAILGTRSRLRYADRLREALSKGAFADMNTPQHKARFRRIAVLAMVGLFGMILSMGILVVQLQTKFASFYGITVVVAVLFGVMASIAGFLMQREINRRL